MYCLQAKDLTLKIGAKTLIQQLNLDIRPGETWGILGMNGSGKTTLLHALAGLHPLAQGQVLLHGKCLDGFSVKSIAQAIGILFQDSHAAFEQTVWEYCLYARYPHLSYFKTETSQDNQIVFSALQKMGMDTLLTRKITQLSGGEKRRLAIAALLAQTPAIYLLDEPANHLDIRYQIHVLEYFHHLAKTTPAAVVMSLHDVNLAQRFCDHVLLLNPRGDSLTGFTKTLLTVENLERVYQCSMTAIPHNDITYWMPAI